jgi:hypothetical protein
VAVQAVSVPAVTPAGSFRLTVGGSNGGIVDLPWNVNIAVFKAALSSLLGTPFTMYSGQG